MTYIIFDLEATCWEDRNDPRNRDSEIIEIGAVKVNEKLQVIDSFQYFIRPTTHSKLSDFCKNLTHITQQQVDKASDFETVFSKFKTWVQQDGMDYYLCSWGFYDKKMLQIESKRHRLNTYWFDDAHVSVKHEYARITNTKLRGLGRALKDHCWEFDGTAHRGIDDAKNIVKLFRFIFYHIEFK